MKNAPQPTDVISHEQGDVVKFRVVCDDFGLPLRASRETRLLGTLSPHRVEASGLTTWMIRQRCREVKVARLFDVTVVVTAKKTKDDRLPTNKPIDLLAYATMGLMSVRQYRVEYYFRGDTQKSGLYEVYSTAEDLNVDTVVNMTQAAEANSNMIGYNGNVMQQASRRIANSKDIVRGVSSIFSTSDADLDLVSYIRRYQLNETSGNW